MSESDVNALHARLAVMESKIDDLRNELPEHDRRLTVVERAMWMVGGAALVSGGGVAALAAKVLGG